MRHRSPDLACASGAESHNHLRHPAAYRAALRQDRVTSALIATGAQLHKHYRPTSWIPHVSVATRAPGALIPVAVTAISDVLPVTLTVARAALVDIATGQTWLLPGIP